jgi:hypothetical protein
MAKIGGDRYLFGFGNGKKWLLFLDRRTGASLGYHRRRP